MYFICIFMRVAFYSCSMQLGEYILCKIYHAHGYKRKVPEDANANNSKAPEVQPMDRSRANPEPEQLPKIKQLERIKQTIFFPKCSATSNHHLFADLPSAQNEILYPIIEQINLTRQAEPSIPCWCLDNNHCGQLATVPSTSYPSDHFTFSEQIPSFGYVDHPTSDPPYANNFNFDPLNNILMPHSTNFSLITTFIMMFNRASFTPHNQLVWAWPNELQLVGTGAFLVGTRFCPTILQN